MASVIDPLGLFDESKSSKLAREQWEWQKEKYDENFELQKSYADREFAWATNQIKYQRQMDRLQLQREDEAVQRRVADLEAAGLSPTLAAGSAAEVNPVHAMNGPSVAAPQHMVGVNPRIEAEMFKEQMQKERLALAMSVLGNIADVSRTKAETELIRAQTGHQDIVNKYEDQRLSTNIEGTQLENDAKRMANSFNQLANPARLTEMRQAIEMAKKQIDIAQLDKEIKTNEKLRQIYYNSEAKFKAALAGKEVELADLKKENIDWDTALKIYSLDYAKDKDVPLSGNVSSFGFAASVAASLRHILFGK